MPAPNHSNTIERWNQLRRESRVPEAIELLSGLFEELAGKERGKAVVAAELYTAAGEERHSYADIWNQLKIILNDDVGRTIIYWRRCFSDDRQRWQSLATALVLDSMED